MEFFDKLGKKASEAYKATADKTGKLAKEAKLRLKIGELKSQINDIYEEIGKKVYRNHVDNDIVDLKKELDEECTRIDVISNEIEIKLKECLELRDRKQCSKCFTEMDKDVKFCPECGSKQEIIEIKEAEVVENENKNENNEKDADNENNNDENNDTKDNAQNNNNEKNNDEQNKGENDNKQEVDNEKYNDQISNNEEHNKQKNDMEEYKENLQKTVEIESNVNDEEDIDIDSGYEYYANEDDEKIDEEEN